MPMSPKTRLSAAEYLERERVAETKSEFFDGEMFAMTGASRNHNLIAGNIFAGIHGQLRKAKCEVYASDMRVKVEATGLYAYPDIVVLCSPPVFEDSRNDTILNPEVIVEVLSDSTEACDRGAKFENYRSIASLSEYVLANQKRRHVEKFSRHDRDTWILSEFRLPDDVLELRSVDCRIRLSDIYEKVVFD